MPPKTPSELKEQVERENAKPHAEDKDVTSEGLIVDRPARADFLANLEKMREDSGDESKESKGS